MRLVAFGGGHGLGACLRALRACRARLPELEITAVVTVGDDGGSSGQLRARRGTLPPGDLRKALAALAAADPDSTTTAELFEHRFPPVPGPESGRESGREPWREPGRGPGPEPDPLAGHPVGNLVLCGLMELLGDPVAACDHAAGLVRAAGRVLPMSRRPVAIEATVRGADPADPDRLVTVRGQHQVAISPGRVERVRLVPAAPPACREALAAVAAADWLVFGPGSWYTSVIPHLLVPELAAAIVASPARRLVILNLTTEPETAGLTVPAHLTALAAYAGDLKVDLVLADPRWVADPEPVRRAAAGLGAELALAEVAGPDRAPRHEPQALAGALFPVLAATR